MEEEDSIGALWERWGLGGQREARRVKMMETQEEGDRKREGKDGMRAGSVEGYALRCRVGKGNRKIGTTGDGMLPGDWRLLRLLLGTYRVC